MRTTHNNATPLESIRTQVELYCYNGFKCNALQSFGLQQQWKHANQMHLVLPRLGIVIMMVNVD